MKNTISIDEKTGRVVGATFVASPNCDERDQDDDVNLLIIHGISLPPGEFGGPYIDQLFTNSLDPEAHPYFAEIHHLRVSAHLLVRRDGSIVQYVPLHKRAWHAGQSEYDGRSRCNDFSIGIELEGTDEIPYTEAQYQSLAALTDAIRRCYPAITAERITGHCHVAPGRKTDPGDSFDWPHFRASLEEIPTA